MGKFKYTEQQASLVNLAFNELLKPGEHYTVKTQVGNVILVKKDIKWAYYISNSNGVNAMFSITTDIDTYAFQAINGELHLLDYYLVKTMYKFK